MMNEMTRYAQIPKIKKGVAFSDPSYGPDVWCQYRKEFEAKDWLMKIETSRDEDDYINISISLGRRTLLSQISVTELDGQGRVSHPSYYSVDSTEIGIDTARVFAGSLENFENWGEEASIYTGADGLFGSLLEFTSKGETARAGYLLFSAVDSAVNSEEEIFATLTSSFEGTEIEKETYHSLTNKMTLGLQLEINEEISTAAKSEMNSGIDQNKSNHDAPER